MLVIAGIKHQFMLLGLQFVSDGRQSCLLEEHLGRMRLWNLDVFGGRTISEPHGPVEIAFGDVALAKQMPELCHIPSHEALGSLLTLIKLLLLLHAII